MSDGLGVRRATGLAEGLECGPLVDYETGEMFVGLQTQTALAPMMADTKTARALAEYLNEVADFVDAHAGKAPSDILDAIAAAKTTESEPAAPAEESE